MKRHALIVLIGTLLIGGVLPWTALYTQFAARPELAVRSRPLHTHVGSVLASQPIGQAFRCRRDGLRRIDVRALAPRKLDAGPIALVVRLDAADGEIVRSAQALPADASGQWVEFEFEPIDGSGGRTVFFELAPVDGAGEHPLRPWTRYRGQLGARRPWGSETLTETSVSFEVESVMHDLSAVALGLQRLEPEAAVELTLFEQGAGEPLRHARLTGHALHDGFAFLTFEPIPSSYARSYRAELSLPRGAVVRSTADGPTWLAYHGAHSVDAALVGMTRGRSTTPAQDLVFRAWSRATPAHMMALLIERVGQSLSLAFLGWLAFVAFVLHLALDRK